MGCDSTPIGCTRNDWRKPSPVFRRRFICIRNLIASPSKNVRDSWLSDWTDFPLQSESRLSLTFFEELAKRFRVDVKCRRKIGKGFLQSLLVQLIGVLSQPVEQQQLLRHPAFPPKQNYKKKTYIKLIHTPSIPLLDLSIAVLLLLLQGTPVRSRGKNKYLACV